jgi:hypothetical protein
MDIRPGGLAAPQNDLSFAKTKSAEGAESASAPMDARTALVAIITVNAGSVAGIIADQLLACVRAHDADFRTLSPMVTVLLTRMPVDAWDALQQHALESGGVGIRNVSLPNATRSSPHLMNGLKRLPHLESLSLAVAGQAQLDLRGLMQDSGQMPKIEIRRLEDRPLHVAVPPGTLVYANANFVALQKSWVAYMEPGSSNALEKRALAGQNYHHQHRGVDGQATPAVQSTRLDIRLNCKAQFPLARNGLLILNRDIACRHLSLQWLADRDAHRANKAEGSTKRFPYGPYETTEGISGHVPVQAEFEYARMMKAGAQSLCEAGQFGNWLSREFGRMQDGQTLRFGMGTRNHFMSLELQRKGSEYVVNFYDPNATATHQRMVVHHPAQLEGKSLANWIGEPAMAKYFGEAAGGPGMLAMYGWPADPIPAANPRTLDDTFVSAAGKSSPEYVFCSLSEGQTDRVKSGMRSALDRSQHSPAEVSEFMRQIGFGLGVAMRHGHKAAMEACVASVLEAKDEVLTAEQKHAILRDGFSGAFLRAHTDVVATFAGLLATAPHDDLPTLQRYRLLLSSVPGSDDKEDDIPILQLIAGAQVFEALDPAIVRKQHQAVFAFVREIASSPRLPLMTKQGLCEAMYGDPVTRTAARTALAAGNPGVAGAMVCAILEAGADPASTEELLGGLGVSIHDVLAGLRETRHWDDAEWARRILNSLGRSSLPKVEIDALVRNFSAKALMENRLDAILSAPAEVLNSVGKCKDVMEQAIIDAAFDLGEVQAVRTYSKMVASVAPHMLGSDQQIDLLLARAPGGDPSGQPILNRIAAPTATGKLDPGLLRRQHESIFAYLYEVVAAPNLSVLAKAIVCASAHGEQSAAQAALASANPGAAGALMLALLQGASDVKASAASTRLLLKDLGVAPGDVLSALDASGEVQYTDMARSIEALLRAVELEGQESAR